MLIDFHFDYNLTTIKGTLREVLPAFCARLERNSQNIYRMEILLKHKCMEKRNTDLFSVILGESYGFVDN